MTLTSRLSRLLRRLKTTAPSPPLRPPPERWEEQWTAGHHAAEWLQSRRTRGALYADLPADRISRLAERFPQRVARTIAASERILRHEFNLLGSGPYSPVDSSRVLSGQYAPIDWVVDPIAGLRFPTGFRHTDWTPAMRPGSADIKLPWELGRCQHWVTLGQAYRLTGDERFATEIVRQHADFLQANPIGAGVQYTCTMDVAIRAVNWALAFELIRSSRALDDETVKRAYRSMFDLGSFIGQNLENTYEVTSNHFLSNVVGVCALGAVFHELPAGGRWLAQARAWLEEEMRVQVLDDGADYESSVPYHRLVTELFLSGARLAQMTGSPLSDGYLASLRRMIEFLVAVTRPDGLLPQVGDADDGRLHIFSDYGDWNPQDGRHVLGPAAFMFDAPEWLACGGEVGSWEAAWWGYEDEVRESGEARAAVVGGGYCPPGGSSARLFEDAGVAVARSDGAYLIVTNGRVGTNGFGNHKHNDLLSFEFHARGQPLIVDPGSYVYTSDPEWRNRFRGTAFHNTLRVDEVEQNDLKPEYLFRLFETSTVEHVRFEDAPGYTEYVGRHTGYARLPSPVVHERTLRLDKDAGALLITDRLQGSGRHALAWHFHFAPGVVVAPAAAGEFVVTAGDWRGRLFVPRELAGSVCDSWYSPSYGVRVSCRALNLTISTDIAVAGLYVFAIGPDEWRAPDGSAA